MYSILQPAHSWIAYIALALLLIASLNGIFGLISKRPFKASDRQIGLMALIFTHIQLLIGLILYFVSQKGFLAFETGSAMSNGALRLTAVEHPLINIIAIILITIGWSKHKKKTEDTAKFKSFAVFYTLGLILILSRIPWSNWI